MIRSNGGCYLANNVIVENTSNSHASGLWILPPNANSTNPYLVLNNTIANNTTLEAEGTAFSVSHAAGFQMHNNLVAMNGGGGYQVSFNVSPASLSCNLLYGFGDSYYMSIPGIRSTQRVSSLISPYFCDMEAGDYSISDLSPASPLVSSLWSCRCSGTRLHRLSCFGG
jgi:hypothetical protein